jgi:hypothetical protein
VIIAALQSCATFGPSREPAPCDEEFEKLLPAVPASGGLEIAGKLRMDLARYRVRGLVRITFSPEAQAARIDFRTSSLFGAVEEDLTLLVDGGLVLYDRERGGYSEGDSTLALVENGIGERIVPRDLLGVLLFALPRCEELQSPVIEHTRAEWELKGVWRDRLIEIRGDSGAGVKELRLRFPGDADRYIVRYGNAVTAGGVSYPAWIRLSREKGEGRIIFELTDINEITPDASLFTIEGLENE